jgi:hypothetical protein
MDRQEWRRVADARARALSATTTTRMMMSLNHREG